MWVVPTPNYSTWFTRLDWHLNWQMCKGLARRSISVPEAIESLASEYEIAIPSLEPSDLNSLMIAGQQLIPTSKCLVLPYTEDFRLWLERAAEASARLNLKEILVFLPADINITTAKTVWSKVGTQINVKFIQDNEEQPWATLSKSH